MASILDLFNSGFTPMNAQGAQAPMGFMDTLGQNRNSLIGLGLGLMGGTRDDPMGPALRGYQAGASNDQTALYRQQLMRKQAQDQAYQREQDKLAQSNWERTFKQREDLSSRATTDDIREYQFAKNTGEFTGSFPEWQTLKNSRASGQEKALPAELSARVAMAGKYLDEYPIIREKVAAGEVTGAIDATKGYFGVGAPGELVRKLKSGTDALLRNLTGAGMPEVEAKRYVARYEPQPHDKSETVLSKMDQLNDELTRIESEAYRARGGLPKANTERRQVINDAMDAIKRGAPRDQVMKRLRDQYGVSFMESQ